MVNKLQKYNNLKNTAAQRGFTSEASADERNKKNSDGGIKITSPENNSNNTAGTPRANNNSVFTQPIGNTTATNKTLTIINLPAISEEQRVNATADQIHNQYSNRDSSSVSFFDRIKQGTQPIKDRIGDYLRGDGKTTITAPTGVQIRTTDPQNVTYSTGKNVVDKEPYTLIDNKRAQKDSTTEITGTPGRDIISAFTNNATINTGGGNDELRLHGDNNTASSQGGSATVFGRFNTLNPFPGSYLNTAEIVQGSSNNTVNNITDYLEMNGNNTTANNINPNYFIKSSSVGNQVNSTIPGLIGKIPEEWKTVQFDYKP